MIRYLFGDALNRYPRLRDSMFADRAAQFHTRLKWDIQVDENGFERDQYDPLNPLYVIWERPDGTHGGSLRYLPTMGRTMIEEHFAYLVGPKPIRHSQIWECTRFCLAPGGAPNVSAALMLGGLEVGLNLGLSHAVGVFDARMLRVYGRLGWPPAVLGQDGAGRAAICAGLWAFTPDLRAPLLQKAGLSAEVSNHWYRRAFGGGKLVLAA
ncbi:acyl-homoserine-lactone synthase [Oceaniglobus ichthyenteri]|uniref:acyl-homoserine-lactone synthase n=1 Tax=Oceaniglobus ichthyenteri TaxID=2136177 RepID=UPI000D36E681|nr:acyl-homoserine-lactone synthase [Oceaniglobus ichthyenteri]